MRHNVIHLYWFVMDLNVSTRSIDFNKMIERRSLNILLVVIVSVSLGHSKSSFSIKRVSMFLLAARFQCPKFPSESKLSRLIILNLRNYANPLTGLSGLISRLRIKRRWKQQILVNEEKEPSYDLFQNSLSRVLYHLPWPLFGFPTEIFTMPAEIIRKVELIIE